MLPTRENTDALLTPENRHIFLYDPALYDEWLRTSAQDSRIIADRWQVYIRDDSLVYVSQECADRDELFYLHFTPQDTTDLPASRQEYGYDNHDFDFPYQGFILANGACVIERPLPEYDIIGIHTGQYTETGRIWEGEYHLPAP